ncbi:MAG: DUF4345 family protein [Deltaproteobacteria bacterium]|nr:DUF4345 family protein [Deltaproteobacteria bacterium]
MAARIFLAVFGLFSLPYGIYCFVDPGFLADFAGVAATSTTGTVELKAMYGGLQAGFGALALFGALRPAYAPTILLTTVFQCAGLGSFRLMGALSAGEFSSYTTQGVAFELASTAIAFLLWRSLSGASAARSAV